MDYVKISGVKYPFSFSVLAQREMQKKDISKIENDELTFYFLWLGFKYGAIREKKDFDLSQDELLNLLDDDYQAFIDVGKLLGERLELMNQAEIAPAQKK